jgi:archaemetzincin
MMYHLKFFFLFIAFTATLISCRSNDKKTGKAPSQIRKPDPPVSLPVKKENKEILIQPFSDLPSGKSEYVYKELQKIGLKTKLLSAINLPYLAYYKPRNRFRADSLITWLKKRASDNQIIAGITAKDISTTKGVNHDYGVIGLGFLGGPACMISTYRLKRNSNEQLFKTVIHELGHNFGLDHCPVKTCIMRDAEGKNTTGEEKEFCPSCKAKLMDAGWTL